MDEVEQEFVASRVPYVDIPSRSNTQTPESSSSKKQTAQVSPHFQKQKTSPGASKDDVNEKSPLDEPPTLPKKGKLAFKKVKVPKKVSFI
jgi:hypothetical protein